MDSDFGSVTRPLHIITDTHDEHTKRLEDIIRESKAFNGKWQSYITDNKLKVPDQHLHLFESGGVITIADGHHLMLFGSSHWALYQRWLAHKLRVDPSNRLISKVYRQAFQFSKPDMDGFIQIDPQLIRYAGLSSQVALIGMVYYFEIHNKGKYLDLQNVKKTNMLMAFIRKLKHNKTY